MAKIKNSANALPNPLEWSQQTTNNQPNDPKQTTNTAPANILTQPTNPAQTEIVTSTTNASQKRSITERLAERQAQVAQQVQQAEESYNKNRAIFEQYHDDYISGRRNPVADMITRPKRDETKEKRLKQAAIVSVIVDAVGLIGKGYAASQGVKPTVTEGVGTMRSIAELRRLDDIYREEGYRYDQQKLMDALRRKSAEDDRQKYRLGLAYDQMTAARAKADAADKLILSQELSDEERAYKDKIRKEDNTREDRWHSQQLFARRTNDGRNDDRHVVMMMTNPVTGNKVPIYEGQFYSLINDAVEENPKLKDEIEAARDANGTALESKYMLIAANQYNKAVRSGKIAAVKSSDMATIIKDDADSLKKNGETTISISDLRYDLGVVANGASDNQLVEMYKQFGITVTK